MRCRATGHAWYGASTMHPGPRRCLLALVAGLALATPGIAQAQDVQLERLERQTAVRQAAGLELYSRWDESIDRYRLVLRDALSTSVLAVAPQVESFDADIGTNSRGRPAAIVSLCDRPRGADGRSGGCDLVVISIADRAVRAVTNANTPDDEARPTIDRGRIAFTRSYRGRSGGPVVYTKALVAPRARPSTRQSGVPRRRCVSGRSRGSDCSTTNRRVSELKLSGTELAQIVTYGLAPSDGTRFNEVRLVDVAERTSALVAATITGEGGQRYLGLSFAGLDGGRAPSWYLACDSCAKQAGAFRYRPGRGYERALGATGVAGYAWYGAGTFQVRRGRSFGGCGQEACRLVRTGEPQWRGIARSRVVRPLP